MRTFYFCFAIFTVYQFWSSCDLFKKKEPINLTFFGPNFIPLKNSYQRKNYPADINGINA